MLESTAVDATARVATDRNAKRTEFARGWPVLLAAMMGGGTGVAVLQAYSLSALIAPLSAAFGWSRAAITLASIFFAVAAIPAGYLLGALADRFGARPVALSSQLLLALCFASLSQLTADIRLLYAAYLLLAILGGGTLPMTWGRAITGWFVTARGFALGLSLFGTGLIGAVLPSYVSWLVLHYGWRGAFLGLAALPLAIGFPFCALLFRDPPEDRRDPAASRQADAVAAAAGTPSDYRFAGAVRTACFWQMCACFLLGALAVSGVLAHSLSLLADRGVPRSTAAAVVGVFGIAVTLGRLVSGYCLDLFRGPVVAVCVFAIAGAASCALTLSGTNLLLGAACIGCVGLAAGAEADIGAYFVARFFGRRDYGAIYGLLYAIYCLGGGAGPPLAGAVFDSTGSYRFALYGGGGALLTAALLAATLRPPPAPRQ